MGHVPKPCYDTAVANSYCDPHDIDVWDVTYIDNVRLNFWKRCKVSKLFCQCIFSPTTIEIQATDFGKIPVKARQWIYTVSSYSGPEAAQPGTAEITLTSSEIAPQSYLICMVPRSRSQLGLLDHTSPCQSARNLLLQGHPDDSDAWRMRKGRESTPKLRPEERVGLRGSNTKSRVQRRLSS
ncbi:hypothetical protein QC761_704765 [Podospora bellae-mahoneyi]|uniref:Uncharacterized protein n=1 Tax=Podospora bellae-mahoneyi TaxID=2093777 RepID=A0ABR0F4L6_9PEZI|nr:hypothetical protein QC761_704765 [Podospora bellae-mahoneyi]